MEEAQNTVNQENEQYQNDESVAQEDANQCSSAQVAVQADQADGSSFLSGDQETEQSECSRAQSAVEQVSSDAIQLSQDEATLKNAQGALAEAEAGD